MHSIVREEKKMQSKIWCLQFKIVWMFEQNIKAKQPKRSVLTETKSYNDHQEAAAPHQLFERSNRMKIYF